MAGKKGFLQISFGWMFALIIGAFVLFLAIYFVVQFSDTQDQSTSGIISRDIGILLNPLETGFESGKKTNLELNILTRIQNNCSSDGNFGKQLLTVIQQSYGKWPTSGITALFENKYVFSENITEGNKFTVFTKPFYFPYKVADLTYIISKDKKYCFVDVDKLPEILKEINSLQVDNIINVTKQNQGNCPSGSEIVCFGSNPLGCDTRVSNDMRVSNQLERITKEINGSNYTMLYNSPETMYAAIFSSPAIYECQLKRLVLRQKQLAILYGQEIVYISNNYCNYRLDLNQISGFNYNNSLSSLRILSDISKQVGRVNDGAEGGCRLW